MTVEHDNPEEIVYTLKPYRNIDKVAIEANKIPQLIKEAIKDFAQKEELAKEHIGELGWQIVEDEGGWRHVVESYNGRDFESENIRRWTQKTIDLLREPKKKGSFAQILMKNKRLIANIINAYLPDEFKRQGAQVYYGKINKKHVTYHLETCSEDEFKSVLFKYRSILQEVVNEDEFDIGFEPPENLKQKALADIKDFCQKQDWLKGESKYYLNIYLNHLSR